MSLIKCDVCVIGAGSGGLSVAAGAAQMGAKVVLIEKGEMGGDCLNSGCVPSKAMLAAAKQAHALTKGAKLGIAPAEPEIDFAAVKDHVARTIAAIAPVDSQERYEGFGVTVIREHARFTSPDEMQAGDTTIRARRFVLATGSRPLVPPIEGIGEVPFLTNESIFDLREKPRHLLVVGGGPIGIEMAQAHRRLGCEVTVIEGAKALGKDDPELAGELLSMLRDEGIRIEEEAQVTSVSGEAGAITVETSKGRFEGSHLLLAVGREVVTDGLGLDVAHVKHDGKGITVGDDLRSVSNRKVYAVGDAAGGLMFTHVAGYHAGVIIRSILFGLPSKAKTAHLPWATYTDPGLAQVGLTEAQAREVHGDALKVIRAGFDENDRAIAEGRTEGMLKLMAVKGRPVGATILGAEAGNLIGVWAIAIASGTKLSKIAGAVLPYPTLGEINKRAAGNYFSASLFDNEWVKKTVRTVQRWVP
ncbi:dihydrolipoyl dehydrogenase family protein [Limimaricola pyoseonensis]|uniref:Pyruvate/2-oxoglutarate dehydrogenase complex, dihydrolipoamide dehydrogenase (E3) component n=1 Tax=Limimaricola pyoseonensis TaxID=521013 RepID=A0A1G7KWX8_9RHOB|nr:FAD-dependent oxidoreductase [Limimaricola pyoseonensis]SDF41596.1 Pyruvate/2-oxoglutarate dehydrogenase complex, dihydrolipoamide dehydrogenase (E3) component [Limimaricola pyoseonensis]